MCMRISLALPDHFFPFLFFVGGKKVHGDIVSTSLRSVLIGVKCIVLTLDDVLIYFDHVFFTIVVRELLVGYVNE